MFYHWHNDFLLYGVTVTKQEKDTDIVGKGISASIRDANVINALMGFSLLRHKLPTRRQQLLTIAVRQQVCPYPTLYELLIATSYEVIVIGLGGLCRPFLSRRLRGTPHKTYQPY